MRVPAQQKSSSSLPDSLPAKKRKHGVGEPRKNYLKIPNAYFDLIENNKLSGAVQRDLILIIMRHTWGADGRPEWAPLSLSQIQKQCGGISKGSMMRELQELESRRLIASKVGDGCKGLKLYKLTTEKWRAARPYATKPEVAPELDDWEGRSGDILIVKPKAAATVVPARLALKDREPVDFRISYTSSCSKPVQVSSTVTEDVVVIHFAEQKAKDHRPLQRPIKKSQLEENTRLSEYSTSIIALFSSLFDRHFDPSDPADRKFQKQLIAAAGTDLPAAEFEAFARAEVHTMVRRRKTVVPGILITLAAQSAKHRAKNPAEPAAETPAAPLPRPSEPLDPSKPWDRAREYLKGMLSAQSYANWFEHTRQITFSKTTVIVAAESQEAIEYIQAEHGATIIAACHMAQVPEKIEWRVEA